MGAYLSEPITKKESSDEVGKNVAYGASSMQGWRISQEVSGKSYRRGGNGGDRARAFIAPLLGFGEFADPYDLPVNRLSLSLRHACRCASNVDHLCSANDDAREFRAQYQARRRHMLFSPFDSYLFTNR